MSWYASVARACRARSSPRRRRNSPHAPGVVRGSMRPSTCAMRALGLVEPVGRQQRFGGDQLALRALGRRAPSGERRSRRRCASASSGVPRRIARRARDDAHRPLVPPAGLPPVGAVGVGGALQIFGGALVVAAHQRHLRQRVVDGAGGLVERARRCALAARGAAPRRRASRWPRRTQIWPSVASDAASRCGWPESLVQRHGAFGQRERLVVAVAEQGDVRLVACRAGEHVVGAERGGHAVRLAQRRGGVVVAALLREHHARQRVHLREVTAVAGGVQRRRGFGRCARARSPCRRPSCSRGRARSGRGRWRASRARPRRASARGCAARWRATARRGRTRPGRGAARVWRAGRAAAARESCRAIGRAPSRRGQDRPAAGTPRRAPRG